MLSPKADRSGSPQSGATSSPPAKQDIMADSQEARGCSREVGRKLGDVMQINFSIVFGLKVFFFFV